MSTLTARQAELRTAREWALIVFLKDGRSLVSHHHGRSRQAIERYIERRVREIDSMAKPMSIVRTGGVGYRWKNFLHAVPVPAP